MKPRSTLRSFVSIASSSLLAISSLHATSYTWTNSTIATLDWTTAGNWDLSTQYVSGSSNELIFFSDSITNIAAGTRNITTNVPATLSMNTLTLNGKGFSSGASSSTINIASSASTWTIGDGTTSIVNLNGNFGATSAAGWNYDVKANLTLNQTTTTFAGTGTGGLHVFRQHRRSCGRLRNHQERLQRGDPQRRPELHGWRLGFCRHADPV